MATHFKLDTITRSLKVTLGALLFLIFSSCSNDDPGQRSLKLLNENWKLSKLGSSDRIKVDMPATVQNTLFKDGLINDPFSGNEEHNIKWIEKEDWEYRTWFKPTAEWFDLDEVELICNGLDTYATVFLNGDTVLKADNMFRTWSANIKPYLKSGRNDLRIIFNSPIEKGNIEKYKLEYRLPTTDISETNKVASFVRKAPFHFGWDWAPRIITTGVWKDIEIKGWNHFSVEDLGMEIKELNRSEAKVVAKFNLKAKVEGKAYLRVTCDEVEIENNFEGYLMKPGINYKEIEISIKDPKLWWPNGEGDQDLYHFNFDFSTDPQQKNVTRKSVRTGLRRVKLIQQRDSIGTSFYFTINNRKVFAKGANYIPQDVFLERKTDEEYRKLLLDVHRSNMNMIRVWGGGVYERDIFYDLCDSLGIMVWQDFMFACAMYPGDEAFLENVRREVDEQSKRLSNHPSLVLWCGNNEIDVAWNNWGWQEEFGYSYAQASKIYRDYELIFKEMIPDIVDKNDGDVPYVHTSPISNWGTKTNFDHSSMHYWGVWHGEHAFEKVKDRVPRFMAEYGFQSFPNTDLLSEYIDPKNLDLNSDEMLNRQKSYKGTGLIEKHIKDYYKVSDSFEDFVYLSQLTQAKYMKMAINTHRLENERCSGTLYWQLNDCWPGPSWSTMDHYGNWKAAQYMVKD
ncbi:MAG: glycoside hydrolase family 2 protein, partial [Flavobacteriales bacterium]|nr:glycoside hydrolase family 2 protein [Flavobacteriales bacterium]